MPITPKAGSLFHADSQWGLTSTFMGTSVAFPTDPSGVIGGTQFNPDYQFSPKWLSGTEAVR
jgi:hypothetical protein